MREELEKQRPRFLRLRDILAIIPVSRSGWWLGVRQGRFPKPLKLGVKTTVWHSADIDNLLNHGLERTSNRPSGLTTTGTAPLSDERGPAGAIKDKCSP